MASGRLSRQEWVALHSVLLEEEHKAEVAAAQTQVGGVPLRVLEGRGVVLARLVVGERATGLYGRLLLTFTPHTRDTPLPAHKFSSGDIVGVYEVGGGQQGREVVTGVVVHVSQGSLKLGVEEGGEEVDTLTDHTRFNLHKLTNEVSYRRIKTGLQVLEKGVSGPASHLVSVLFSEGLPRSPNPSLPPQLTNADGSLALFNTSLDESQVEAVRFAVQRSDLCVVHGPPGTGKTTTVVEVIRQHLKLKCKVLACAPSNLAVDNLVERLAVAGVRLVRLGHPARTTPLTQQHTLDALLHRSEESQILTDIRQDISKQLEQLKKARDKGKRHHIKTEIKNLRKELRERETKLTRQVVAGSEVVLATLTSSGNDGPLHHLPPDHFDLVVIDECSQAVEAACYLALLRAPKLIIAGDHCQLPPTIVSEEAAAKGLQYSLMERVIEQCGQEVVRMLTVQYRMHHLIMEWASAALYQHRLTAHPSVATHLLAHLPHTQATPDTETALVLIDTAGCECWELDTADDQSKGNPSEAVIVSRQVEALVSAGVPEKSVAVITPYNLQVELVRGLLRETHPGVEVRSVDGFQGREKEAVIISLVRSNKEGTVGFLSEDRRLNVAVTRARRHLTVVCNSDTVGQHQFLRNFVDYVSQHGTVRTAHEFQHYLDTVEVQTPECIVWKTAQPEREDRTRAPDNRAVKNKEKKGTRDKKSRKPEPPSEEDNARRRQEYTKVVTEFFKSAKEVYEFSPDLNAYERRLVHEISEELGLQHKSKGEGKERHIILYKNTEDVHEDPEGGDDQDLFGSYEEEHFERIDFESRIENFVRSSNRVLKFTHRLNSFQRHLVHDVCESFGLKHYSEGEGRRRCIVARKTGEKDDAKTTEEDRDDLIETINESDNTDDKDERTDIAILKEVGNIQEMEMTEMDILETGDKGKQDNKTAADSGNSSNTTGTRPKDKQSSSMERPATVRTRYVGGKYEEVPCYQTKHCCGCGRDVPEHNFTLHQAQCGRRGIGAGQELGSSISLAEKPTNAKKKKAKKTKKKEEEEEDFDTLIAQFTKENNTCFQPQCKTPTSVIYQLCPFCQRTFCLAHHMAEVHGCGDAARQQARKTIVKEGVLYPGSGVPSKKPNAIKRKQMERKLNKKMEDLSNQRKPKQPGKDKGKEGK